MSNATLHEICKWTGKWMLTEREAGNIVRIAKRSNIGRNIPKSIYFCPLCCTYHTTHYAFSNAQKRSNGMKKLSVYHRSSESKLRIYDYL